MGMNGIKRGNLGVHGVLDVVLWYCQKIKKRFETSPFLFVKSFDENLK